MKTYTRHTKEQRELVKRLASEGLSQQQIAIDVGVSKSTVSYWLRGKKDNCAAKKNHCPNCGATLPDVKNMMFCPFCAADVATPAGKTARDLGKMLEYITKFYPAEHRDFAVQTINKAIEIIKEER